ncbi:hypothetical protein [Vibrio rumoiensis]|uniref:DoxX protein n=1 Tax=Vibrio rumoiensis 1S-45 TaxID=1188252 RepID=A0A1E5DZY8_9VIBR|nr:hypothetical protein [Vibrio rumoiensis]OEF23600.1 hypothetical protein A1QC_11420 [Vibrio rumoiensis 1S-45]
MSTTQTSSLEKKLAFSLLALRVAIALVFMVWAFDKIVAPEHTTKVFSAFYGIDLSSSIATAMGIAQVGFVAAFALGLWKNVTYLAVLVLHAGSTLSAFAKYLDPFSNLLFFAAWPMLAACFALYLLRDFDVLVFSSNSKQAKSATA